MKLRRIDGWRKIASLLSQHAAWPRDPDRGNCLKADPAYGKGVADTVQIPVSEVRK